jgi:DNA repair exonuclease SbcCD ATPase subunit
MADWEKPFAELCQKTHTNQAKWFLNGFWDDGIEKNKEDIWNFTNMFIELQTGKKVLYGSKKSNNLDEKCDLDELQAHHFLEKLGETLTVKELRARLKKLDIDSNNRLCLSEYLLSRYNKTPQALVDSPQGGVPPEVMDAAQDKCDDAQKTLDTASEAAAEAKKNKNLAKAALDEAEKKEESCKKAAQEAADALEESTKKAAEAQTALELSNNKAAEAKTALEQQTEALATQAKIQAEVNAAVEALELEEKTLNDKIKKLEDKLADSSLSTVKRGSYVQQLAGIKSEDPMPLRKAKITQKAVLKKQKKATKKAEKLTAACAAAKDVADEAAEASAAAKVEADNAAALSKKAKEDADAAAEASEKAKNASAEATKLATESEEKANEAVDLAVEAFKEARAALEELKNDDTPPNGAIWWMERIMTEKEKFMPRRKKKKKN